VPENKKIIPALPARGRNNVLPALRLRERRRYALEPGRAFLKGILPAGGRPL
jgi:hypothetical protein